MCIQPRASPRHAQADVALDGIPQLPANPSQEAGIAVEADVAGQLAGDATTAFERGAAVAACRNTETIERDGVDAIGSPPHVALEIRLPHRAGAAESPSQQRACAPGEHVGAVERDGRLGNKRPVQPDALPDSLYLRLERQPRRQRDRIAGFNRSREGASILLALTPRMEFGVPDK